MVSCQTSQPPWLCSGNLFCWQSKLSCQQANYWHSIKMQHGRAGSSGSLSGMSGLAQSASHPNLVQASGGSPSRQNSTDHPGSPRLLGRGGLDYSAPHLPQQVPLAAPAHAFCAAHYPVCVSVSVCVFEQRSSSRALLAHCRRNFDSVFYMLKARVFWLCVRCVWLPCMHPAAHSPGVRCQAWQGNAASLPQRSNSLSTGDLTGLYDSGPVSPQPVPSHHHGCMSFPL